MLWALRGAVLLFLLLAFLDPRWPAPARVVYLLDFSPSAREGVFAVAGSLPRDGIYVAFAERAVRLPAPTARRLDLGEGTDLRAAFREAEALGAQRVVLVSDGLLEPVPPPFPLDAVHVPPSPQVAVRLVPPPYPLYGETVGVGVVLEAPVPAEARLRVEGPGGILERSLRVEGRRSLVYAFSLTGEARVRARVEGEWGVREAEVRLAPADRGRALVLGDPALARYLEAQGFQVEEGPFRLPLEADLVAVGLGVADLPEGAVEALRAYLHRGGGLLFTATPKGLFFGGWDRFLAEDLPLKPLNRRGAALVLVLDVSGSMAEERRLEMAVQGALSLVRSASEDDYLGVVLFSSEARWLFPPRPMTPQGRREAESLLLSLRPGGGTILGPAYREAVLALQDLPVERKEILVLSDGIIYDPPEPILELARTSGMRTSTLALGAGADQAFLETLARAGGGTYYFAPVPQDLPRLFLQEGERLFAGEEVEGAFPLEARPHPLTEGFLPPPARVLLPARAEPWAEVLLWSGERAVLAVGERGEGRVAALATDLSRSWGEWEAAAGFLGGLARYLMGSRRALALYAYPEAGGVQVAVLGDLEAPVALAGGRETPLVPVAPGRFEARLPGEGVLLDRGRRVPLALPPAGEWAPVDGRAVLRALAEGSGGRLLTPEELGGPVAAPLGLRPYLLALALALFLLERLLEARASRPRGAV
ncbi:vWA domain-containing protein [Thermus thermamylovorans]|uniref:VWA domain-containing protein n=1 Tax=Thermus thermamylovorans TaxID=2509362 RepID=A0A4V2IVA5_9DEIN|nr:vWA domain-containing protein [Thermus thermamylovorans]TBH21545.1 VWA domain-containing protein [Thermus thermamylovorans]